MRKFLLFVFLFCVIFPINVFANNLEIVTVGEDDVVIKISSDFEFSALSFELEYNKSALGFVSNKFSETLFNGGSGEALKYFLKGEINNKNIRSLEIAKMMEKDPEVQVVIKKLKFYLRKTAKGLSYEEYTDLKVQKGKFRSLFGKAEKEYLTRYHKK